MTPTIPENPTIADITTQTLTYAPAAIAGVQAAELSDAAGTTKFQAVVNGILATSQAAESVPNPDVAGIAALVNLTVSIFKALNFGPFKQKPAPIKISGLPKPPLANPPEELPAP